MNDYTEAKHGLNCLAAAWHSDSGKFLRAVLKELHADLDIEIAQLFDSHRHNIRNNTFISCLSEHDASEDELGRLSMWRAYGGATGVALVLDTFPFFNETDALESFTAPVSYLNDHEFSNEFEIFVKKVQEHSEVIRVAERSNLIQWFFSYFQQLALCTKHPAFREEREWRIVYSPEIRRSKHMLEQVVSVKGVPQVIYKIPLNEIVEENYVGVSIPKLLKRIIIGPCAFPLPVRDALIKALEDEGVERAWDRIHISSVPLR